MSDLPLLYEVINLLCLYFWLKQLISDNGRVTLMKLILLPTCKAVISWLRYLPFSYGGYHKLEIFSTLTCRSAKKLFKSRARIFYRLSLGLGFDIEV